MSNAGAFHRRLIAALLAVCVLALLAAEVLGRFVVPRVSRIEGRAETELREVRALSRDPGQPPALLLLGNSLLNSAVVDGARVQQAVQSKWQVHRLVVLNTQYLDWYYGMRNLVREGEAPQVVALMLNAQQLLSNDIRGAYSAYRLFGAADSIRAGRDAGLHITEISGLVVGHFSGYYGLRLELRKFAFQKLVPDAEIMSVALVRGAVRRADPTVIDLSTEGARRIAALRALCNERKVRCLFLVPPEIHDSDARRQLVELAEAAGLEARRFDVGAAWPVSHFDVDRFHFSQVGADAYVEFLAQRLHELQ